jgi:hypothetical protein
MIGAQHLAPILLLRCGCLAGGFARFRCDDCGLDRLVLLSCKGRAVCASCGGRRMAERAAHLADHVFPPVPVRQWVVTLPHRLRYRLAWDHDLCRAVVGVAVRTVLGFLRRVAHLAGVVDGRGGAVAIVQRFGGAMNLNVRSHALVIDGVFARDGAEVRFCPAPLLTAADVADVLATVVPRVRRLLERRGLGDDEGASAADEWAEDAPVLAGMAGASVQGTFALGPRAGQRARPCGAVPVEDRFRQDTAPGPGRRHARQEGFDLEAGVWVPVEQRDRLERLCRYALRPTVAQDRLRLTSEGQVVLQLRHPWADGTTDLLFDPLEVLERLAVLIPRPRINLILYHGALGPRAAWRSLVVAFGNTADCGEASTADAPTAGEQVDPLEARATDARTAGTHVALREASATEPAPIPPCGREGRPPREEARLWADLMRRTFGIDVLACPRCGPSAWLRAILSTVEGWRALPADRADRRCGGDRAHSAASAPAHGDPNAASGAGTAASRDRRVQPGHGHRCLRLIRMIGVRRCLVAGGPLGCCAGNGRTRRTGASET